MFPIYVSTSLELYFSVRGRDGGVPMSLMWVFVASLYGMWLLASHLLVTPALKGSKISVETKIGTTIAVQANSKLFFKNYRINLKG